MLKKTLSKALMSLVLDKDARLVAEHKMERADRRSKRQRITEEIVQTQEERASLIHGIKQDAKRALPADRPTPPPELNQVLTPQAPTADPENAFTKLAEAQERLARLADGEEVPSAADATNKPQDRSSLIENAQRIRRSQARVFKDLTETERLKLHAIANHVMGGGSAKK